MSRSAPTAGCLQRGHSGSPGCCLLRSLLPFWQYALFYTVNAARFGFEARRSSRTAGCVPTLVCTRASKTAGANAPCQSENQHPSLAVPLFLSLQYLSAGVHKSQASHVSRNSHQTCSRENLTAAASARPPRATQGCKPLSCKQLAGSSMHAFSKVRDGSWLGWVSRRLPALGVGRRRWPCVSPPGQRQPLCGASCFRGPGWGSPWLALTCSRPSRTLQRPGRGTEGAQTADWCVTAAQTAGQRRNAPTAAATTGKPCTSHPAREPFTAKAPAATSGLLQGPAAHSLLLPLHLLPQKPQLFLSVCLLVHTPGLPHWSGLLAGQVQPPSPLHWLPLQGSAGGWGAIQYSGHWQHRIRCLACKPRHEHTSPRPTQSSLLACDTAVAAVGVVNKDVLAHAAAALLGNAAAVVPAHALAVLARTCGGGGEAV